MLSIKSKLATIPTVSDFVEVSLGKIQAESTIQQCNILMKTEYDSQKNAHNEQKELYNNMKKNKQTLTVNERKGMQLKIDFFKRQRQSHQDAWLVLYQKLMLSIDQIKLTDPEFKHEHQESLEKIKEDFQNPKWRV
jgi:hypothetical protein